MMMNLILDFIAPLHDRNLLNIRYGRKGNLSHPISPNFPNQSGWRDLKELKG